MTLIKNIQGSKTQKITDTILNINNNYCKLAKN